MPAPARHAYVPDQLRELATAAKLRGLGFEEWWQEAMPVRVCKGCGHETLLVNCPRIVDWIDFDDDGILSPVECNWRTRGAAPPTFANPRGAAATAVLWPTDAVERRAWLMGVDSARDGWQDAYEGRPALRQHHALAKLAEHLRQSEGEGNERGLQVA